MIVRVPGSVGRLRREAGAPPTLVGAEVFVRIGLLRRPSPVRAMARVLPMAAAIAVGVAVVVRGIHFLIEPPELPRRRKRGGLREALRPSFVDVDDRVRYSTEFLRTASGVGLGLRRGRVVAERLVSNYPGDPSPRQVVTVAWDDDPEPHRVLHHNLEVVGKAAARDASTGEPVG